MDYINRLNNSDISEIANITVGSELYEEALVIFEKAELLVDYVSSIEPATESAERIDEDEVCVMLGKLQQLVDEAMPSFVKACTTMRPRSSSITSRPSRPRPNSLSAPTRMSSA